MNELLEHPHFKNADIEACIQKLNKYGVHPHADVFTYINENDIRALATNIKENGLKHKIQLYKGKIIDGRNRFIACEIAGVEQEFEQIDIKEDQLLDHIMSLNTHRRHLSPSQRGWIAAKIYHNDKSLSQDKLAQLMNVSRRIIGHGIGVHHRGSEAIKDAVQRDRIPLTIADRITKMPEKMQSELLKLDYEEMIEKLRKYEADKRHNNKNTVSIFFSDDELAIVNSVLLNDATSNNMNTELKQYILNFIEKGAKQLVDSDKEAAVKRGQEILEMFKTKENNSRLYRLQRTNYEPWCEEDKIFLEEMQKETVSS